MRSTGSFPEVTHPVAVVGKVIDLLEAIAATGPLGLTEIAGRTSINKASAFRILSTLEARGYVEREASSRRYQPGPKLLALGMSLVSSLDILRSARPELVSLAEEFGETVNLGLLNEGKVLYLDIIQSRFGLRMSAEIGNRDPLHSTALGKAILAPMPASELRQALANCNWERFTPNTLVTLNALEQDLKGARERGYSIDDQENEHGARCIAVPVMNQKGRATAALSVSGPAARIDSAQVARIGERLKSVALSIQGRMGYATLADQPMVASGTTRI